jgi:hypothetical protein
MICLPALSSCDMLNVPLKEDAAYNLSVHPVGDWAALKQAVEDPAGPSIIGVKGTILTPAADTDTNPDQVLPSDAIVVKRRVTIASFDGASAITRNSSDFRSPFFEVRSGGRLVLGVPGRDTLTLDGGEQSLIDCPTGILTLKEVNAACILRDGAIITGSPSHGGAVIVKDKAVFTMEGGEIRNSGGPNAAGGVNVESDGHFVMTGGSITGNTGHSGGGVTVQNGSFVMTGGTIAGNTAGGNGGGVFIGSGSSFDMIGGNITGNTAEGGNGGGVYVQTDGAASMTGGTITGNTSGPPALGDPLGGGVYLEAGADYALGADISGNVPDQVYFVEFNHDVYPVEDWAALKAAAEAPDGPAIIGVKGNILTPDTASQAIAVKRRVTIASIDGASAITRQARFTAPFFEVLNGGRLTLGVPGREPLTLDAINPAWAETGILRLSGTNAACTLRDGVIITGSSSRIGAVVSGGAVFTMGGGEIKNTGGSDAAGGVKVESGGRFVMTGGSITGNTGYYSGGVYINGGSFVMTGGTIADNTANYYGGGVYIGSNSTFDMIGGNITGNKAASYGGGVYVQTGGTASMTGGTITGNVSRPNSTSSTGYGGGVFLQAGADYALGADISGNVPDQVYYTVPEGFCYYNRPSAQQNGVNATVAYSPASPRQPGTQVTATVSFSGTAAKAGAFSVSLASKTVNVSGGIQTFFVTAGQRTFGDKTFSFTVPSANVSDLNLIFSVSYSLSVGVVSGQSARGRVTPDGQTAGTVLGSRVTVTATPASGYVFVKWVASDNDMATAVSSSAAYTFTINANTALYAVFAAAGGYSLSVGNVTGQDARGTAAITTGGMSGNQGYSRVTVRATPASGYVFVKWVTSDNDMATAVSASAAYTFDIKADTALYAVFAVSRSLSAGVVTGQSGWGSAAITTGRTSGNVSGSSVTVKATPASDYVFVKWVAGDDETAAAVSTREAYTFTINADTALYAVFAASSGSLADADTEDFGTGAVITGTRTFDGSSGPNDLQHYLASIHTPGNYVIASSGVNISLRESGPITSNWGGGVCIGSGGTFNLNSPAVVGDIYGNTAGRDSATAQVYNSGGTFKVNGVPADNY